MNFFQSLVLKIANRLGLQLQKKPLLVDTYSNTKSISLTATIAQRVATLTLMDSDIHIKGESYRAMYLNKLVQESLIDKLDLACEVALGTGDCIIKPYTDGNRIDFDIIKNNDFYICESIGDYIKSIIIRCEVITENNGNVLERYETQKLSTISDEYGNLVNVVVIFNFAFKNGIQIPLTSVSSWANIEEQIIITDVDQLLLGRIKSPTTNRDNINSPSGVPITFGLDSVMKNAIDAYERFNREFEVKEPFIFADKTLFKKDPQTGNISIPNGKSRIFMSLSNLGEKGGDVLKEYSPDIRTDELKEGIEQNYKMLEMLAGLSNGILTSPTTNFATATEIKANLHNTYAYMSKFRRSITKGIRQLMYSINILCDVNNITPVGFYELYIDYSSAYLEDLTEQYSRLIDAHSIGAVSLAEVRAWLMDESIEAAESAVEKIKEESGNLNK